MVLAHITWCALAVLPFLPSSSFSSSYSCRGGGGGGGGYGDYGGGRGGGGGGYGDRGDMRRSDSLSNSVGDGDPYYSSFSEPPAARGFASHDYNHGSGDLSIHN
jgi:hypothetical protein